MELDKLAQTPSTTTIRCTVGSQTRQFTLDDANDVETGIQLHLTDTETGTSWTLTQQGNNTYRLTAEDDKRIEVLSKRDIVIA